MDLLKNCINSQVRIREDALKDILASFEARRLKKGDFFLHSGQVCREMAFIETGYLRMYDIADGKEITFWIGSQGRFVTSLTSFIFEADNYWNIQALTESSLFVINREKHFELSKRYPEWLEFDNLLLAHAFALLERNMFSQLHTTAQQRYDALVKENPTLLKHVPLQYIASMLGITPESLSRLRKNAIRGNS